MKCLNLHNIGDLRYEDIKAPQIKKGEVLVKIKASGICGSDIQRVFEKGTYNFPTVIGHEFAGEIVEGENKGLIGKKCAVFPLLPCFKCDACKEEQYAQCANYNYFGSRCDGGMAEFIAVPEFNLVIAEDSVPYDILALTEPCAVARHSLMQSDIKKGDALAVFGAGPIGLMIGMWAKTLGVANIVFADIDEGKVQFAKSLGFGAINSSKDGAKQIKEVTGGGADIVIEGTGVSVALEEGLYCAKNFSKVVLMGNPIKNIDISQKAYWEILRKQLTVKGTWNSGYSTKANDWKEAVSKMATGELNLAPLISHKFALMDYKKAFNIFKDKNVFTNKVLFVTD